MRKASRVQLFEPRIAIIIAGHDKESLEGTQKGFEVQGSDVAALAKYFGLRTHYPIYAWESDGKSLEKGMEDLSINVYPSDYDTWEVVDIQAKQTDGTLNLLVQWTEDEDDQVSYSYRGEYMIEWAERSWKA